MTELSPFLIFHILSLLTWMSDFGRLFECEASAIFNDRFYLSFFVATHGFRESDFDYYSISYSSAHKSRPNVSMCVYMYAIEELSIQK